MSSSQSKKGGNSPIDDILNGKTVRMSLQITVSQDVSECLKFLQDNGLIDAYLTQLFTAKHKYNLVDIVTKLRANMETTEMNKVPTDE